jgi:hypothetical protein
MAPEHSGGLITRRGRPACADAGSRQSLSMRTVGPASAAASPTAAPGSNPTTPPSCCRVSSQPVSRRAKTETSVSISWGSSTLPRCGSSLVPPFQARPVSGRGDAQRLRQVLAILLRGVEECRARVPGAARTVTFRGKRKADSSRRNNDPPVPFFPAIILPGSCPRSYRPKPLPFIYLQWTDPGSNRGPKDFQSFALPAELSVLLSPRPTAYRPRLRYAGPATSDIIPSASSVDQRPSFTLLRSRRSRPY